MGETRTKDSILDELYALRAGLSVISEGKDQINQSGKNSAKRLRSYSLDFFKERGFPDGGFLLSVLDYNNYDNHHKNPKEYYDREDREGLVAIWNGNGFPERGYEAVYGIPEHNLCVNFDHYDKEREGRANYNRAKSILSNVKKEQRVRGTCSIVFAVLAVICVIFANMITPLIYIGMAACLIGSIISLLLLIKNHRDVVKYKWKEHARMVEDFPLWKNGVNAIIKAMEQQISPIIHTNQALYMALQNQYSHIIDERDWQYLDLVIYYLETGRADTIKEALLLVDKEMQTQRIIQAINDATNRICTAIHAAANRISAQLNKISSQLTMITAQQQIMIAQNNYMIGVADMQNALLKKANVSSEQLMKDVSRIRSFYSS